MKSSTVAVLMSALLCSASLQVRANPPSKLALRGARIITMAGDPIEHGTLLIENGKITAIGRKVELPYDAMEVDVTGKTLFPGMIDAHSARGLDVSNENFPVTPYLDVYDALDPSKLYFEDALRDGVTSIHVIVSNNCVIGGVSRVVHPIGLTPDEMTLQAPVALKFSVAPKRGWDRMAQMAALRETFLELADYLDQRAEEKYEESLKKKDNKIDVGPDEARKRGKPLLTDEDYDDKHLNLIRLKRGELSAFIYCGRAGDVGRAIGLARKNGFFDRSVFVLGPDCYKAVEPIKNAGRPVVLAPQLLHRHRNPITGKLVETFVPRVYADAGVMFALTPSPDTSLAERYLNYQAARCVRHGVPRKTALSAITLYPAKILGIDDRVGSLEVGKMANVLVLSGDPLDFSTWVEEVYIQGIRAYQRKDDVRLKQLLGEEKKPGRDKEPEGKQAPDKGNDKNVGEQGAKPADEDAGGDKRDHDKKKRNGV